jgi:hypothetical protein
VGTEVLANVDDIRNVEEFQNLVNIGNFRIYCECEKCEKDAPSHAF